MKLTILSTLILSLVFVFSSCKQSHDQKLIGKWKLARAQMEEVQQIAKMAEDYLQSLKDSAAIATDSAAKANFDYQVIQMEEGMLKDKAEQDSMMKSTFWDFKADSIIEISQMGNSMLGKWWINDSVSVLSIQKDGQVNTVDIKLAKDTLTLQFDPANYMNMVRVKE